jgi:predicted P-loop ATPase
MGGSGMTEDRDDFNDVLRLDGIEAARKADAAATKYEPAANGHDKEEEPATETNGGAKVFQLRPRDDKARRRAVDDWQADLILSTTKSPKAIIANALIALRNAPEWQGVLAYDDFALVTKLMRAPPWLAHHNDLWMVRQWTDRDDTLTADWLQHHDITVNTAVAAEAAEAVAKGAAFHPIQDYLNGLQWDGEKRIERLAAGYLGADDKPYHTAVSRCLFIAGVARIMQPGCKADYVPIFEGIQDKGKSTAIELLFSPWFSDDLAELGSKDSAMQVRVAWGIEIPELASMSRADIDRVKAFITRKVDRFRPSYGRRVIEVPRQSVFVGSTNQDVYLKDETGGRRFWPIHCTGKIDLKAIERDKDQFWAEAVALYKAGTPWWFTDAETIARAREEQSDRYQQDPWFESIARYLKNLDSVDMDELLMSLGIDRSKWTRSEQMRVAACLKALKWERYQERQDGGRTWRYRRVTNL